MRPVFSIDNSTDSSAANAKFLTKFDLGILTSGVHLPDFQDLLSCQFRPVVPLSWTRSFCAQHIIGMFPILPLRHIFQIAKLVISLVPVFVVDFFSVRALAYKNEHSEPVNIEFYYPLALLQVDEVIPRSIRGGSKNGSLMKVGPSISVCNVSVQAPNTTKVASLIVPIPSRNISPYLFHLALSFKQKNKCLAQSPTAKAPTCTAAKTKQGIGIIPKLFSLSRNWYQPLTQVGMSNYSTFPFQVVSGW